LLVCFLIVFFVTVTNPTHNPNGAHRLYFFLGIPLLVLGSQLLQAALAQYRNAKKRYRFEIKVDEQGILRRAPDLEDLFLSRSEIIGFTEHRNGTVVIRTGERQRFIYALQDLDNLQALRQELLSLNICRVDTPKANWFKSVLALTGFLLPMGILGFATSKLAITFGGVLFVCFLVYGYVTIRTNPNVRHKRTYPIGAAILVLFAITRVVIAWR